MDNLTSEQRSMCMSHIKSKWTKQEIKLHNFLKGNKIKHKMHPDLVGSPDISLPEKKTVLFLHGCFWHKCPKCYKEPKTNRKYWLPKLKKNVNRDKINISHLKKNGWRVIVLWEHQLKKGFNFLKERVSWN